MKGESLAKKTSLTKAQIKTLQTVLTSRANVNDVFGASSTATVQKWIDGGMPRLKVRGQRGRYTYPVIEIMQWLRTEGSWRPGLRSAGSVPDDDELLMIGEADSPALERYRLARAKTAELDLAQRNEELVSVDLMRNLLLRMATELRQNCIEALVSRYGPDAGEIVNRALEGFRSTLESEFTAEDSSESDLLDDRPDDDSKGQANRSVGRRRNRRPSRST